MVVSKSVLLPRALSESRVLLQLGSVWMSMVYATAWSHDVCEHLLGLYWSERPELCSPTQGCNDVHGLRCLWKFVWVSSPTVRSQELYLWSGLSPETMWRPMIHTPTDCRAKRPLLQWCGRLQMHSWEGETWKASVTPLGTPFQPPNP